MRSDEIATYGGQQEYTRQTDEDCLWERTNSIGIYQTKQRGEYDPGKGPK